jgi:NAD(P)-dependent dehydrogenase (short-subunit alcohol dehydrogenase family)
MMKLKGKNAIVTGCIGLGRAIAEEFLSQGAGVYLCARSEESVAAAVAELGRAFGGGMVAGSACDVSSEEAVLKMYQDAVHALGPVDVLVNNAGVYGPFGPAESVDLDEWRRAMEINILGTLLPCRAVIPDFKRRGSGKIICISGGGATTPMPNVSAYAASKAGAVRLMETLSEELKEFNIQVNGVAPGALKTRMMDQVLAAGEAAVGKEFFEKNKRWAGGEATPLALGARLCAWLASGDSGKLTGRLFSAQWDPWEDGTLERQSDDILQSDIYTLRRITPKDRGRTWDPKENR